MHTGKKCCIIFNEAETIFPVNPLIKWFKGLFLVAGSLKKEPESNHMENGVLALHMNHILDEDIELIRRVKSGDPDSFSVLVEKYSSFVFGIIRGVVLEPSVEEDLAQETFLQAYRGLKSFREQSRFKTWLYRITFNVCLSYLRKKKQTPVLHDEPDLKFITDKLVLSLVKY